MTMSPDAMEACARRIEDLELDVARWKKAYTRLANNRMAWIDATLRHQTFHIGMSYQTISKRISDKLRDRLRRVW
jgi:hypothetical protein